MTAAILAGLICCLATAVNLASLALGAWRIRPPRHLGEPPVDAAPVSLVRPICELEQFSEETLRSGFLLDYPDYEIVFCVARANDPVIPLARRLMAEYPGIPSRLIVGDDPISANPKLNNCVRGWDAARHDWVILADSNVLMPADYVQRLIRAWRPDTGLVCSTPAGSRPSGFWAEVECAFLNSLQARWQYAGEALGLGFAQGKSMLWKKSFLEARGGIRALAAEIAEDAAATKLIRRAGLHVHLVDAPFEQPLGRRTAAEVWSRQLRWARLRRVTFPLFFAPEAFSGAMLPMLAGALAAAGLGWNVPVAVAAVAALWYGPEALLARAKKWPFSWRMPIAFVVRDALLLPMWAYAWVAEDVVWRGNAMSIRAEGSSVVPADNPTA